MVSTQLIVLSKQPYKENALLLGGLTASVAGAALVLKIPASLFNGAVAIIIAPPLCLALRKALQKTNIQMP